MIDPMDTNSLPKSRAYRMCSRCVMDTSDPLISFDQDGVCNHCHRFDTESPRVWHPSEEGRKKLSKIVDQIKQAGHANKYDCVMGLSGGADSSFLAYQVKRLGLRPLAIHVDAGWNTEVAVQNIEAICRTLGIDLYTQVLDWAEVRDLQLAFLKSGLANQDIPQDHAFFASIYRFAAKNRVKYVLVGGNYATESILPKSWGYNAMDSKHLKSVHRRFGTQKLRDYPTISFVQHYIFYRYVKGMKIVRPLNYMPYNKKEAIEILSRELGWRDYGFKHGESRFTRFFQNHFLPTRFGYDKRKPHLSSLILAGQITREEALMELKKPLYDEMTLQQDLCFVAKKLGISETELVGFMSIPTRTYLDYDNNESLFRIAGMIRRFTQLKGSFKA